MNYRAKNHSKLPFEIQLINHKIGKKETNYVTKVRFWWPDPHKWTLWIDIEIIAKNSD